MFELTELRDDLGSGPGAHDLREASGKIPSRRRLSGSSGTGSDIHDSATVRRTAMLFGDAISVLTALVNELQAYVH